MGLQKLSFEQMRKITTFIMLVLMIICFFTNSKIVMASLTSLGVPYLAPLIPFHPKEWKDALVRGDLRKLINSKHTYPYKK